ncbi:MAG: hypothetical protein MRERV_14c029 [Mycoplasmataceae bacterium RV_VA103A]|nr:MAG: hypothetical protein MRERV_14c029 [Mycoplasmataceae bacterium RV_VA103A]
MYKRTQEIKLLKAWLRFLTCQVAKIYLEVSCLLTHNIK